MTIAAILCEYNPFHAGHAKLLQITRQHGATHIVCIMSGPFTQRGEAAIGDKWWRAGMALAAGADVVLELPVLFALQSAEGFARGGVRIAEAVHADMLSFGAEEASLPLLTRAASILSDETPAMSRIIRERQRSGESHARAKQEALASVDPQLGALLLGPNNILAIEYLRAIEEFQCSMKPLAVQRSYPVPGSRDDRGYLQTSSSIRAALRAASKTGDPSSLPASLGYAPDFAPLFAEQKLFSLILYAVRMNADLTRYAGVDSAMAARIRRGAEETSSWNDFLDTVATRWLPQSRLRRALLHILLGTHKDTLAGVNSPCAPLHARLLGFRAESRRLLGSVIGRSDIPIVTKFPEYPDTDLARADLRASDLFTLLYEPVQSAERDKAHPPVII